MSTRKHEAAAHIAPPQSADTGSSLFLRIAGLVGEHHAALPLPPAPTDQVYIDVEWRALVAKREQRQA